MLLILNPFPILWRKQGSIVTSLVTLLPLCTRNTYKTTFPDLFVSGFAHLIPILRKRLKEKAQANQEQDVTHTHSHMGAVSSTKTGYLGKVDISRTQPPTLVANIVCERPC